MKELIRKILREDIAFGPERTNDWIEKMNSLSTEERIEFIKDYKSRIEKLLPRIIDLFKSKFGDELVKIKIDEKPTYYGNESFQSEKFVIMFYFDFNEKSNDVVFEANDARREIYSTLKSYFDIDITRYPTPLSFQVYHKVWEKVY